MMHVIQRDIKTIGPRTSHHGEIATKVTRFVQTCMLLKAFNWHANMPTQLPLQDALLMKEKINHIIEKAILKSEEDRAKVKKDILHISCLVLCLHFFFFSHSKALWKNLKSVISI
ncbi:hypothetical protein Sjap_003424 [Stephania japonica]|uniref:Uncharacterized protein n=1 Tax=Stephania japonica TaxID=461633 RepID=A0AAP0KQG6_9MAGN